MLEGVWRNSHRDMDELDEVANETHDGETDSDSFTDLKEFCVVKN